MSLSWWTDSSSRSPTLSTTDDDEGLSEFDDEDLGDDETVVGMGTKRGRLTALENVSAMMEMRHAKKTRNQYTGKQRRQ